ncbi:MAG TPA: hypothetical protein V6D29_03970 [Leptolyngbyaceae cyanobacterium]
MIQAQILSEQPDPYETDVESSGEEPVTREFKGLDNNQVVGFVTRNRRNYAILNTYGMLAIDVDLGDPRLKDGCFVNDLEVAIAALREAVEHPERWGGEPKKEGEYILIKDGQAQLIVEKQEDFPADSLPVFIDLKEAANHPGHCLIIVNYSNSQELGFRVYRTAAGLRYICTTHKFDPLNEKTQRLMRFVYTDTLYRQMCVKQGTYRMRLSPKRYRMTSDYDKVCDYMLTVGQDKILPEFQAMVRFHDLTTGAYGRGSLA